VSRENGRAMLTVHDNGKGFDPTSRPEGHFGLRVLRDLARERGGDVRIESSPGGGTTIRVEAPT